MSEDSKKLISELYGPESAHALGISAADSYRELVESQEQLATHAMGFGATDELKRMMSESESALSEFGKFTVLNESATRIADQQISTVEELARQTGDANSFAKHADDLTLSVGDYHNRMLGFDKLSGLSQAAGEALDRISLESDFAKDQIPSQHQNMFSAPRYFPVENAYQNEEREHRSKLINALKSQNKQTAALIQLNEAAQRSAHKASKWSIGLTAASLVLTVFVVIFTVFAYLYPPQPAVIDNGDESAVTVAEDSHEQVAKSSADEKVTSDLTVSEEIAPPQPSPTAAHAPADSAPSSSDQSEP